MTNSLGNHIHFAIFDNNGNIIKKTDNYDDEIYYKYPVEPEQPIKINCNGLPIKIVKYGLKNGFLILYTTSKDMYVSSKRFNFALDIVVFFANNILTERIEIEAPLKKQYGLLVHNMKSLNAHILQEIYNIIPQEKLYNSIEDKIKVIENIIKSKPNESAKAILKILHSSTGLKIEFSVYQKLFHSNPRLSKAPHSIHKVLMNMLYGFFPDFTDKHIRVNVDQSYLKGYFDYESIHVAFYYILENAVKYTKKNSDISIHFDRNETEIFIYFEMVSLKIRIEEKNKIFDEGYSGVEAKKRKLSGSGMGMARAKKIIQLNGGTIEIVIDDSNLYGIDYQKNTFIITLPLAGYRN